jgi:hypothetical protein
VAFVLFVFAGMDLENQHQQTQNPPRKTKKRQQKKNLMNEPENNPNDAHSRHTLVFCVHVALSRHTAYFGPPQPRDTQKKQTRISSSSNHGIENNIVHRDPTARRIHPT